MSELDAKLESTTTSPGTRAKATLKQLQARWGELELIRFNGMDGREVWRHVNGRGLDAVFERVDGGTAPRTEPHPDLGAQPRHRTEACQWGGCANCESTGGGR